MTSRSNDMTDLDRPLTVREFREFRTELETRLETFATKDDLKATRDELRRHFDTVAESFKGEFRNLFDWSQSQIGSVTGRVAALESDHGTRLLGLEGRVTRLESRRK